MSLKFQKILIVHTWGIGDLVMFTSALRVLRSNFPGSQIDVLVTGRAHVAAVLEEGRTVNKIFNLYWESASLFEKLKLIWRIRKEKYDLSIVTQWVNPLKGGLLTYLMGAKKRAGSYDKKSKAIFYTHKTPRIEGKHEAETNLDILRVLGIEIENQPSPFCEFSEKDKEFAKNLIQKLEADNKILIGFHPGAEKVHRYLLWPKDYFIALGKKILEKYPNTYLLIFCGPDEKDICQEIVEKIGNNVFLTAGLTLKQVMALISRCKLFIASDSGLGHLASGTNVNIISIFGPSESHKYAPWTKNIKVFQASCRNLYDEHRDHTCLKTITPEMVLQEVDKVLERR